jgi:DNA-binding winged helix-turn-helix (wHTH) protein
VQFLFAGHTLDTDRRELRRGAIPIAVEPQVFDLLVYLVQNREWVIRKDDLFASVWGGRIVADATLASQLPLRDGGSRERFLEAFRRAGLDQRGVWSSRLEPARLRHRSLRLH